MAGSEVECSSGVKTAQNSKTEGGIEWKKHENVKLKENVPRAILLREKPEECKSVRCRSSTSTVAFRSKRTYSRSLKTSCLWYSIKCKTWGVPEVICAQRHKTNYMYRHNSRWLLDLSLQVCVPGYPSFPKWAIVTGCIFCLQVDTYIHIYFIGSSPHGFSESMLQ